MSRKGQGMKRVMMLFVIVSLVAAFSAPAMARYERRGAITVSPSHWGGLSQMPFSNVSSLMRMLIPQNRDDKPIRFFIEFYDSTGAVLGRYPQDPNAWDMVPGHSSKMLTDNFFSFLPDDTMVTPIIVWKGDVDVTPMCIMQAFWIGPNNTLINQVLEQLYDDLER